MSGTIWMVGALIALASATPQLEDRASLDTDIELYRPFVLELIASAEVPNGVPLFSGAEVVPDERVAIAIHLAVASSAFGIAKVEAQRPFVAIREGAFWVVLGTLPPDIIGGTAVSVIRASNGEVLKVVHGQ